jgi:hypothetical protein
MFLNNSIKKLQKAIKSKKPSINIEGLKYWRRKRDSNFKPAARFYTAFLIIFFCCAMNVPQISNRQVLIRNLLFNNVL